ncbi:TaqI family restriction endonuclease [Patescibacteria group bacterium]|nr:TaqI family restriction endonuclease [Patescibacteria group bacterium]
MLLNKFDKFLQSVDLAAYREKYRPIKIVEMDLPKEIQAIETLYKVYWIQKRFLSFDDFYQEYFEIHKKQLKDFQEKIGMCPKCFNKGLPARIYRTWASIITQIYAGYVAESVFGGGTVAMSAELDHQGADFQVVYKNKALNYQVKKATFSREVRQEKKSRNKIKGEFIDIKYEVPSEDYFKNPTKKDGEYKLPYLRFKNNKELKRFSNGFVVFTPLPFERKKKEIDLSK